MQNKPTKFEDALQEFGTEKEKAFFDNPDAMALLDIDDINYKKLKICARAWNTNVETKELWKPNYNDGSAKYNPWARIAADEQHPSGFGFSRTDYDYEYTRTSCGSRLCFPSSENAVEFFDTFKEEYKLFWLY